MKRQHGVASISHSSTICHHRSATRLVARRNAVPGGHGEGAAFVRRRVCGRAPKTPHQLLKTIRLDGTKGTELYSHPEMRCGHAEQSGRSLYPHHTFTRPRPGCLALPGSYRPPSIPPPSSRLRHIQPQCLVRPSGTRKPPTAKGSRNEFGLSSTTHIASSRDRRAIAKWPGAPGPSRRLGNLPDGSRDTRASVPFKMGMSSVQTGHRIVFRRSARSCAVPTLPSPADVRIILPAHRFLEHIAFAPGGWRAAQLMIFVIFWSP